MICCRLEQQMINYVNEFHVCCIPHTETKMFLLPTWAVILLFFLGIREVKPGKCPKFCMCDSIQLTVACVKKNLTEIPPSIDEVQSVWLTYLYES